MSRTDTKRDYWCAGLYLNFLAEATETGGDYTLIEGVVRQGTEPPPHTHAREDEEVLVLEGSLRVRFGGQDRVLQPGESALMPKGVEHYFQALTPETHLLVRFSPGGLERGFQAFGVPVTEFPVPPPREQVPGFAEIARIFAELGVEFTR